MCVCALNAANFLSPGECPSGWAQLVCEPDECFYPRWSWGECWAAPASHGASAGHQADFPEKQEADRQRMNSHLQGRWGCEKQSTLSSWWCIWWLCNDSSWCRKALMCASCWGMFIWGVLPQKHFKVRILCVLLRNAFSTRTNMLEGIILKCFLFLAVGKPKRKVRIWSIKTKSIGNVAASVEYFRLCFKQGAGHRGHSLSLRCSYL